MPRWAADVFLGVVAVFALLRILFIPMPNGQSRWEVLIRFGFVWGTMWYLRACTVGLTRFPRLDADDPMPEYHGVWSDMWGMARADFMFSGHAQTMTLCGLFVSYYTFRHLYSQLMWVLVLAGYWAVLAARIHYSADVVVAIIVASCVFFLFHMLVDPECLSGWRSVLVVSMPPPLSSSAPMMLPLVLTDGTGRKWEIHGSGGGGGGDGQQVLIGQYSTPQRRAAFRWLVGLLGGHEEHKNSVWS